MDTRTIAVDGMSCDGCATRVRTALEAVAGVDRAEADHEADAVDVHYDPASAEVDDLRRAIAEAGYEPA